MKKLLLTFLTFLSILNAKIYETITYDGLIRLSDLSAIEISEIKAGDDISEEKIDSAITRFFAQGYFSDIRAEDNGSALVFYFKEKPAISSIEVKGSSESEKEEKIVPLIGMKKGDIFNEARLEEAKKRISQKMRGEGYFDTIVEADFKHNENDGVDIEFQINKGEIITITEQNFEGIKDFSQSDLEKDLANKQREFAGWFMGRNDGKLNLDQLEFDSQRVKNFYMKNGYLDAQISDPLLSVDFSQYAAKIFYSISQGRVYTVGKIELNLLDGNLSLEGVEENFKLKTGKVFNIEKMRKDLQTVEDKIGSQGYAFAKVFPDIQKNEETGIADVVYNINPGKKVYIRDVIISGNSKTLDRVVRREIFLAPGDLYSSVELRESKNALGRLGFFKGINVQELRVSEDKMDLLVKVEETHTASLSVGGGYGSINGVTFNASISDRNVFGSAMNLSLNLEQSQLSKKAEFSIYNPRVNDGEYSLGTNFYITDVDYSTVDSTNNYKSTTEGVSVRSGKRLSRYWNASASMNYSFSDITYEEVDSFYLYSGKTTKISFIPYIGFDNTDDYFTPRNGSIFTDSIEFAGFSGDQEFISQNMRYSYYYGLEDLIDLDFILRYKIRGSYIIADADDYVKFPTVSRLRMGGISTVRGYQSGSISPVLRDSNGAVVYNSSNDATYLGGNQMIVNNLELNLPLIPDSGLRMSLFYDYGMIGQDDFSEERKGYGFSFDWITPMAPLQFVFGWAIDPKSYDETTNFEFTMGQRF